MATYDSLTDEQKTLVQNFTMLLRSWCGTQARVNNHAEAIDNDYVAQASAIIATLDAEEFVPNTSGLDGAAALVKEDLIGIVAHVQGILASYDTAGHRRLWTRATGARNMIG